MATIARMGFMRRRPGCRVKLSANVTYTTGYTHGLVPFDSTVFDDGMFVTATNRIVVPFTGRYLVIPETEWIQRTIGYRYHIVYLNGAGWYDSKEFCGSMVATKQKTFPTEANLTVGNYLQLYVWQDSGISLTLLSSGTYLNVQCTD